MPADPFAAYEEERKTMYKHVAEKKYSANYLAPRYLLLSDAGQVQQEPESYNGCWTVNIRLSHEVIYTRRCPADEHGVPLILTNVC